MHHVAHYEPALAQTPAAYAPHSQGYARVAFVDHTIAAAVHTGVGLCTLAAGGVLNPHVHFYQGLRSAPSFSYGGISSLVSRVDAVRSMRYN